MFLEPIQISQELARQLLEQCGALMHGHFVGTQSSTPGMGWHLTTYVDKIRVVMRPRTARLLAAGLAYNLAAAEPDVILAPPMGALTIGSFVAEALDATYVFPEPNSEGVLALSRDHFVRAIQGRRVGIVEDVINSGKTTRQSVRLVLEHGGQPVGVTAIWNRNQLTANALGARLFVPLINETLPHWTLESCALDGPCSKQVPINRSPGHGGQLERLSMRKPFSFI